MQGIDSDDCHLAGKVENSTQSYAVHRAFLPARGWLEVF